MTQPLNIRTALAGNPTQPLKYSMELNLKSGEKLNAADPKATRALVALMDMGAVIGGAACHYGGPAAFAELMSASHAYMFHQAQKQNKQWHELFHFVNDAGHCENGLYALKANYGQAGLNLNSLKKFRSIESVLCGHGESHLFPEGVLISNGPLGSAFPQSQGLAMADALSGQSRITVTALSDGAAMEGEAREALAAIPGLAAKNKLAPFVLIISDNNTKLSGRIDQESFSMNPTFASMKNLGWHVIELADGHDLQKCLDVFVEACDLAKSNPKVPVAIHAKTIKGIGNKKAAESASGGHGFPLKSADEVPAFLNEIYNGQSVPAEMMSWAEELKNLEAQMKQQPKPAMPYGPEEKIQVGVSQAMVDAKKAGYPIISITSDLPGSTGVAGFRKEFPSESFDVGVAESNMISVAAGMSKLGFIPVVDTFAQFGVTKGGLPLTMAALSEAPMICVFSHTGFQDAADGASHQALTYIAMTAAIPNTQVYCLTSSAEAHALVTQAVQQIKQDRESGKHASSYVFFLGRENFPKTFGANLKYELGQSQVVFDNSSQFSSSVTIVGVGSMLGEALKAAELLAQKNKGAIVINPAIINHPDVNLIKMALQKTQGQIVVIDDHQKIGGAASLISHALSEASIQFQLKTFAVHGEFGRSAYNAIELYQLHRMDHNSVVKSLI